MKKLRLRSLWGKKLKATRSSASKCRSWETRLSKRFRAIWAQRHKRWSFRACQAKMVKTLCWALRKCLRFQLISKLITSFKLVCFKTQLTNNKIRLWSCKRCLRANRKWTNFHSRRRGNTKSKLIPLLPAVEEQVSNKSRQTSRECQMKLTLKTKILSSIEAKLILLTRRLHSCKQTIAIWFRRCKGKIARVL